MSLIFKNCERIFGVAENILITVLEPHNNTQIVCQVVMALSIGGRKNVPFTLSLKEQNRYDKLRSSLLEVFFKKMFLEIWRSGTGVFK